MRVDFHGWMAVACLVGGLACTKPNPAYCRTNDDCEDSARPVCDVDGTLGGTANACVPSPDVDPVDSGSPPDAPPFDAATTDAAFADAGLVDASLPGPLEGRLAAGLHHTCVVSMAGAVRCWGSSFYGQLGYASTVSIGDDEPASAGGDIDLGGVAVQVVAGSRHTCALLEGGAVRCWGAGDNGRLGYGNTNTIGDNETPAAAGDVNLGGAAVQLAAGTFHTCALLDGGAVRCWGWGARGALGYGNTSDIGDDETPASAGNVPVGGGVTYIAAGANHTCAVLEGGSIRCWGRGDDGRLGYGDTEWIGDDESPSSVGPVDIGGAAIAVSAGGSHTCALMSTSNVRCWGSSSFGQLGYASVASVGDDEHPVVAGDVNAGGAVAEVSSSALRTCVRLAAGAVRCWGSGADGGLGYASTDNIGDDEDPIAAGNVNVGSVVSALSSGSTAGHTCALLSSGALRCWGDGSSGQLGYGNTENVGDDETPASAGDVPVF